MSVVSVREVLAMPVLRRARPVVLAGEAGLDNRVRWVHATELVDIAPLLRGGDLVLSTGIALPSGPAALAEFATSLSDVQAAGLMVELGRRWRELPESLVEACERRGLPLIALTRVVRFAAVTQAVGERVVDQQLVELREAERVHETFTELGLAEAGPAEVLAAVQRLAGAGVVLESEDHRVLDYLAGPDDAEVLLDDWQARSRQVAHGSGTTWDELNGWLVARLGSRERGWGRLVLQCPSPPTQRLVAVVERGAAALALHRLHDRDRDNLVRRTHHELLLALTNDPTDGDVLRRCELAGFPVTKRQFVGLVLRPATPAREAGPHRRTPAGELLAATVRAVHQLELPALVCELDHDVRVLLSLPVTSAAGHVVETLAARVSRQQPAAVAAGRAAEGHTTIDHTLREAHQVIDSVRPGTETDRLVHRLEDVHLRGLLTLFGADDRIRLFVSRELDVLRETGADDGHLLEVLRALLQHPTSKADAARSLHLSRPAFYARLARIESLLGARLGDPEVRVSLQVALIADELAASQGTAGAGAVGDHGGRY